MPVNVISSCPILDQIIQIFSDELHFIFIVIFFSLIAYKNQRVKEKNDVLLKEFDKVFFDILQKIRENTEKYKKFRSDTKSKFIFFTIPSNVQEFFINLNNNLKLFPNLNFNIKSFFINSKEINGTKLQRSYGKLIDMSKPIAQLNDEVKKGVPSSTFNDINYNNNEQNNSKIEFSKEKFKNLNTNFDFEANSSIIRSSFDFTNFNNNSFLLNTTSLDNNISVNVNRINNNLAINNQINCNNNYVNNTNFVINGNSKEVSSCPQR